MYYQEKSLKRAYKIKEAAEILGISAKTVRRLIARRLLKAIRVLRIYLITAEELDRFLREEGGVQ